MVDEFFLKPNALIEPLVSQWYAWSHLLSPPTAAMHLAYSYLKILRSFIAAPQVHVYALKSPKMRGGPFINYDAGRLDDVRALTKRIVKGQSMLLEMAEAIKSLDQMLATEANGCPLEPIYQKVPEALRGYVELVYDLNNKPSIRFIEGLLYRSPYYNTSSQSVRLSLIDEDDRFFAFSTPRLDDEGCLHLSMPFGDKAFDELAKMKYAPGSLAHIKDVLGVEEKNEALFSSFFTDKPPQQEGRYIDDAVRIRYFGHACVLMEANGLSILCDPLISYEVGKEPQRYTYADLPERIDFALITHHHQDHCVLETLLQLRHKINTVIVPKNSGGSLADPSLKLALQNIGFDNVTEIDEMETIKVGSQSITGLPFLGEHGDLNIRSKMAYLIRIGGKSILLAADSNNVEPKIYEHIHNLVGDIDVLFIGMECDGAPMSWVYGPLLTNPIARKLDQSRRLDGSEHQKAMKIVDCLKPEQVYVYAMGQEPWLTFIVAIQYTSESRPIIESNRLVKQCQDRGIVSERLFGRKEILLKAH